MGNRGSVPAGKVREGRGRTVPRTCLMPRPGPARARARALQAVEQIFFDVRSFGCLPAVRAGACTRDHRAEKGEPRGHFGSGESGKLHACCAANGVLAYVCRTLSAPRTPMQAPIVFNVTIEKGKSLPSVSRPPCSWVEVSLMVSYAPRRFFACLLE